MQKVDKCTDRQFRLYVPGKKLCRRQNSISSAFLTLVEIWQRPPSSYSIDRGKVTLKENSQIRIKKFHHRIKLITSFYGEK